MALLERSFCVESSRQPGLQGPKCIWLEGSCSWGKPFLMRRLIPVEESEPSSQLSSWETSLSWLHPCVQWQWLQKPKPGLVVPYPLPAAGEGWKGQVGGPVWRDLHRVHRPVGCPFPMGSEPCTTLKGGARTCKYLPTNCLWDGWSAPMYWLWKEGMWVLDQPLSSSLYPPAIWVFRHGLDSQAQRGLINADPEASYYLSWWRLVMFRERRFQVEGSIPLSLPHRKTELGHNSREQKAAVLCLAKGPTHIKARERACWKIPCRPDVELTFGGRSKKHPSGLCVPAKNWENVCPVLHRFS